MNTTKNITVERFSITSHNSFNEVIEKLDAAIGHPEMTEFRRDLAQAESLSEMERVINGAVGKSGFMEFLRLDHGIVVHKGNSGGFQQSVRVVLGNPLIMRRMVKHVPDAGSYAPVTILIDERLDGVHISYDRMASFLASYENDEALKVAKELDAKIEALLVAITAS